MTRRCLTALAALGLAALPLAVGRAQPAPRPIPGAAFIDEDVNDEGAESNADAGAGDVPLAVVPLVDAAAPIARGAGVEVLAGELIDRVRDATPPLLRRYAASPELVQEVEDRLVADRLLAAEARRRGLDRDPTVRAAVERALVARLRSTALNPLAGAAADVSDADARRWYDEHPERFHVPERRRARGVFLATRAEAQEVLRLAMARRRGRYLHDFRSLAASRNVDPELAGLRGELRELTAGAWAQSPPVDDAVRAAVFAAEAGEVIPRVIPGRWRDRPGFWVIRYLNRRAAINRSYEDSREWIRARIVLERRVEVERREVERLAREARVDRVPASRVLRVEAADAGP